MKKLRLILTIFTTFTLLYFSNNIALAGGGGVTDVTGPAISCITMTKNGETLKSGDTFVVSFIATDESTIASANVVYHNSAIKNYTGSFVTYVTIETSTLVFNNITGMYDITLTIPSDIKIGEWKLSNFVVYDEFGNMTIVESLPDYCFNNSDGITDITSPVISNISIDKNMKELKAGDSFILSFCYDDETPINNAFVQFVKSTHQGSAISYSGYALQNTLKYNTITGKYEMELTVPNNVQSCEWQLGSLEVSDNYFNNVTYDNIYFTWNYELKAFSHDFHQNLGFIVIDGITDLTTPIVSDISIDRNGETLQCGDKLIISFKAEDESIIKDATVTFVNPAVIFPEYFVFSIDDLSLTFNNTTNKYELPITIPEDIKVGQWNFAVISVTDEYGNSFVYNSAITPNSYYQNFKFYILDGTNSSALTTVQNAAPNTSVTISLTEKTLIPKEVFTLAKAKNIDITLASSDKSYTWNIDADDITEVLKDIDFGLSFTASKIPENIIKIANLGKGTKQISLYHNGPFNLDARLNLSLSPDKAGVYANLYYYNNGSLEYVDAALIHDDGRVSLEFNHASDYIVIFSDKALDPTINPITCTITATAIGNGSISPSGNVSVQKEASQTFTFTPLDSQSKILAVFVDGNHIGAVTTYTFENISSNHTVTVHFSAKSSGGSSGGGIGGGGGSSSSSTPPVIIEEKKPELKSNFTDWNELSSRVTDHLSNHTSSDLLVLSMTMDNTSTIPQSIIKQIKGNNIILNIMLSNGVSWVINGSSVTNAALGDIDLGVVLNSKNITSQLVLTMANGKTNLQISLNHTGDFGFKAEVSLPLSTDNTGKTASLYYYNPTTNKFEFVASDKIDSNGYLALEFSHASDYLIVIDKNIHIDDALFDEITINTVKETLYLGGTTGKTKELFVNLPSSLATANKKGLINDYTITYSSSSAKVASVSNTGKITAKRVGKATITTTIKLGGHTTTFKTVVTVKKAYFKLEGYNSNMMIADSANISIKAYGYDISTISWSTTKKSIIKLNAKNNIFTASVTAVSKGTNYIVVKMIDKSGKTFTQKYKVNVTI